MKSSREKIELITMNEKSYGFEFETEKANFNSQLENLTNFCNSDGLKDANGKAFALIHVKHLKKVGDDVLKTISETMVEENRQLLVKSLLKLDKTTRYLNEYEIVKKDYVGNIFRTIKEGGYSTATQIEDLLDRIRKNFPKIKREEVDVILRSIQSTMSVCIKQRNTLNKEVKKIYEAEKNKVKTAKENKRNKSCCVIS